MDDDKSVRDLLRLFNLTKEEANARVVAIVCAAYIEDHITTLIRRKMPGLTPALTKSLFDPAHGPLGTMMGKIEIATALEVIPPNDDGDIRLIARIRNKFAHTLEVDSFDHPMVRDLVDKLRGAKFAREQGWSRDRIFRETAHGICAQIMMDDLNAGPVVYLGGQPPSPDK